MDFPPTIDTGLFPIVRLEFHGAESSDEAVEAFISLLDRNLDRHVPYAIVIEAPSLSAMQPEHRRALAEWVKQRHEELLTYCLAQAYVIPGMLGRVLLRSVFVLRNPVNEYRVFCARAEALEWAHSVLMERGATFRPLRIPTGLVDRP